MHPRTGLAGLEKLFSMLVTAEVQCTTCKSVHLLSTIRHSLQPVLLCQLLIPRDLQCVLQAKAIGGIDMYIHYASGCMHD